MATDTLSSRSMKFCCAVTLCPIVNLRWHWHFFITSRKSYIWMYISHVLLYVYIYNTLYIILNIYWYIYKINNFNNLVTINFINRSRILIFSKIHILLESIIHKCRNAHIVVVRSRVWPSATLKTLSIINTRKSGHLHIQWAWQYRRSRAIVFENGLLSSPSHVTGRRP